jgi:hypothetical protein
MNGAKAFAANPASSVLAGLRPQVVKWRRLQKRRATGAMLVRVRKGNAAGGTPYSPRLAPMFWNGAFDAVLTVAIRTGVADLRTPAPADEIAYSAAEPQFQKS